MVVLKKGMAGLIMNIDQMLIRLQSIVIKLFDRRISHTFPELKTKKSLSDDGNHR
ncbi:MAG: hypothetical protein JWR38_2889 [Mucilaginibacter sp.]|nr:hypothetical protein [Mucilaginibacter sp.]